MRDDRQCDVCGCRHLMQEGCSTQAVELKLNQLRTELAKAKDAMLAAYAELQNDRQDSARRMLIVGLEGGSVNNPLDFDRCLESWKTKTKRGER